MYREGVTTPYSLRRTFQTIAKTAPVNQSVIDRIMGHERPDMSEVYNQTVFDGELRKCVNHVHDWLNGKITLAYRRCAGNWLEWVGDPRVIDGRNF